MLSGASSRQCAARPPDGPWTLPDLEPWPLQRNGREGKKPPRKSSPATGWGRGSHRRANPSRTGGAGRVRLAARRSPAAPPSVPALLPVLLRAPRGSRV